MRTSPRRKSDSCGVCLFLMDGFFYLLHQLFFLCFGEARLLCSPSPAFRLSLPFRCLFFFFFSFYVFKSVRFLLYKNPQNKRKAEQIKRFS